MKASVTLLALAILAWPPGLPAQPASSEVRLCLPAWVPGRIRDEVLRAAEAEGTANLLAIVGVRVDRDNLRMDVSWADEPIGIRAVPGGPGSPSGEHRWMRFVREDPPGAPGEIPAPLQRILQRAEGAIDRDPWLPCATRQAPGLCERVARGDTGDGKPPSLLPVAFPVQVVGYLVLLILVAASVIRAVRTGARGRGHA